MAKLIVNFVSSERQRFAAYMAGLAAFLLVCAGAAFAVLHIVESRMKDESQQATAPFVSLETAIVKAFGQLDAAASGRFCGPQFQAEMRRVALLPDGLNEFMAIDGNNEIICSVSRGRLDRPVALGKPDLAFTAKGAPIDVWVDRSLDIAGFWDFTASIARRGQFAVVFWPPSDDVLTERNWLESELVLVWSGRHWHRKGVEGIYSQNLVSPNVDLWSTAPVLRTIDCYEGGVVCIASTASLTVLFTDNWYYLPGILLVALLAAIGASAQTRSSLARRWSFEARFLRTLGPDTVRCVYQPIMDLKTGQIGACEVLARWRDVDGSTVFPDAFIPIVEKNAMTLEFTRMVVERAYRELSEAVPKGVPLVVTFNIFPSDLNDPRLPTVFRVFDGSEDRFILVAELVESEEIDVRCMQARVDHLRAAGIRVLIDDFGTGYSNIKNLVDLSVDGVKLDRAFAMAPDGTVAARMLDLAIEMVQAAGRAIVVEGIETEERLEQLRQKSPAIEYVQGFFISRPLEISAFVAFLEKSRANLARFHGHVSLRHEPARQMVQAMAANVA